MLIKMIIVIILAITVLSEFFFFVKSFFSFIIPRFNNSHNVIRDVVCRGLNWLLSVIGLSQLDIVT